EVLRLADDRAVRHPEEDARHLLRDRVEGAAEDAQRDRVDLDPLACRRAGLAADLVLGDAHATAPAASTEDSRVPRETCSRRFPKRSTLALKPGGMTVVESYCVTIAGP